MIDTMTQGNYGSGATSGTGYGSGGNTDSYSGQTGYGSGTTGGAGESTPGVDDFNDA